MESIIEARSGQSFEVKSGDLVTIIDIEGKQVADFYAVNAHNFNEFLSTGVTIDCNESLKLKKGDRVYSNLYNVMFTVLEDDVDEHDLLHPCCRPEMYGHFYRNGDGHKNCLANINESLAKHGVPQSHSIHPVNLFMHTIIRPDGTISVEEPRSKAGDGITLLARMDTIVGIASCSVEESKCNGGKCTPVKVIVVSRL